MKKVSICNKTLYFILLVVGVLGLNSCSLSFTPLQETLDLELEKAVEGGLDGIIVYVNKGGNASFHSAGFKNRENQIPADPYDLFRIASISKLYIAAAATLLISDGELNLETSLLEMIPEVDGNIENAEEITLKMLIQHRSGIPEYIYEEGYVSGKDEDYLLTASLIFGKPADFAPDKRYKYSNTNYLLLGQILDQTLGYSHHEFIRDEILLPLGLTNTYSLYSEVDSNLVMSGYIKGYEPDVKFWDHTTPGGSMIATAEDVGIFLRALIDGTLFNDKEQAIYSSVYNYEHTGWLPGYTSIARYHCEVDAVIVQFVNTSSKAWFWLELERVYKRISRIVKSEI